MASHLAVMFRLNHFKAININRESDFRVGSIIIINVWFSRHYSDDQFYISPQANTAGELSPRYLFRRFK